MVDGFALKGRNNIPPGRLLRPFRAWVLALLPTQGVALGFLVWPLRGIQAGRRLRPSQCRNKNSLLFISANCKSFNPFTRSLSSFSMCFKMICTSAAVGRRDNVAK